MVCLCCDVVTGSPSVGLVCFCPFCPLRLQRPFGDDQALVRGFRGHVWLRFARYVQFGVANLAVFVPVPICVSALAPVPAPVSSSCPRHPHTRAWAQALSPSYLTPTRVPAGCWLVYGCYLVQYDLPLYSCRGKTTHCIFARNTRTHSRLGGDTHMKAQRAPGCKHRS